MSVAIESQDLEKAFGFGVLPLWIRPTDAAFPAKLAGHEGEEVTSRRMLAQRFADAFSSSPRMIVSCKVRALTDGARAMFEGFRQQRVQTSDPAVTINLRYGGNGPPVLLMHGNPLTHVHWHLVAPRLAQDYTVVVTDLRGYGDSSKPRGLEDHSNYSFRRMALDQVEIMEYLGFKEFFVAGHDRGARTAVRMALDHPDTVRKLASFDILPTHHVLTHATWQWALNSYHWFFMAQPYDIPEKLIAGKEDYYILKKLTKMGIGKGGFSEETLKEYARCCTPENIHAVCEDYRAGVRIDMDMDTADFEAGRKVDCPSAIFWGELSHTEKFYDPRKAWPQYASNIVRMRALPCGHYPAEQAPDEVYSELARFFRA